MTLEVKFDGGRARKQAAAPPPFGPEFSPEVVTQIETLEVHVSEFKDPGADFCEFRAFDAEGRLVGSKRIEGY